MKRYRIEHNPNYRNECDELEEYLRALKTLGAKAIYVIPIYHEYNSGLTVIRVVAPPFVWSMISQEIVAFLGPSLTQSEANQLLPAIYLPPASQGSVYEACKRFQPNVIAIIDGVFRFCSRHSP